MKPYDGWGSSLGVLGDVEYPFITLTQSDNVLSIGQIELFDI